MNEWLNKLWYICTIRILLGNKKEQITDTFNNLEE